MKHNSNKKMRLILIIIALLFIYIGVKRGDMNDVYNKASKICFECIGIG